ncbi:hypothetical protein C7S18_05480 [Ahniella affigens]|uniref:Uncharacterized protein n=1 Tax=Ahniella affigens TaxID=2021234 RepID=A0A2P1PPB9_9GAMM|nr:hypothetical protein [Ahniella affigens]AVP96688.1 hypothetical protein C7S18_05480 [Ahniella affigens]
MRNRLWLFIVLAVALCAVLAVLVLALAPGTPLGAMRSPSAEQLAVAAFPEQGVEETLPADAVVSAIEPTVSQESPAIAAIEPATRFDPSAWPPLPPVTEPLADVWPTLKDRADQGDHQAACRLALELRACFDIDRRLQIVGEIVEDRTKSQTGDVAATLSHAESLLGQSERCAQIPESDRHDWRYIRQAARAGNVAAMETFALEHWLPVYDRRVPVAELKQILRERDALLIAAMKAGSLVARNALVSRLGPSYGGLALDRDAGLSAIEREQMVAALRQLDEGGQRKGSIDSDLLTDLERAQVEKMVAHMREAQRRSAMSRDTSHVRSPDESCATSFVEAPDLSVPLDWRREMGLLQ